jgi:hypothetical protein
MLQRNKPDFYDAPKKEAIVSTGLFEQWLETNRAALAPAIRWQKIAAETGQKLIQHNLAVGKDYMDFSVRQLQLLGEIKDLQKWVAEESKIAVEFSQRLAERIDDFFKFAKDTQEAVDAWAEHAAKTAATSPAAKPA